MVHPVIEIRPASTDADLEAWLEVRRAVLPNERAPDLDELRSAVKPGDLHVLAELGGELAGSGLVNRSDTGNAHVAPRVLPDKRGRGVGAALLEHLTAHAVGQGYEPRRLACRGRRRPFDRLRAALRLRGVAP